MPKHSNTIDKGSLVIMGRGLERVNNCTLLERSSSIFECFLFVSLGPLIIYHLGGEEGVEGLCLSQAVFTLGARALVPGHRHKMVLCSDTRYPV